MDSKTIYLIIAVVCVLIYSFTIGALLQVWLRAWLAGAYITFGKLVAAKLKKVPVGLLADSYIVARKSALTVTVDQLENHHLAGGHLVATVQALIAAKNGGLDYDWDKVCAIDLGSIGTGMTVTDIIGSKIDPRSLG